MAAVAWASMPPSMGSRGSSDGGFPDQRRDPDQPCDGFPIQLGQRQIRLHPLDAPLAGGIHNGVWGTAARGLSWRVRTGLRMERSQSLIELPDHDTVAGQVDPGSHSSSAWPPDGGQAGVRRASAPGGSVGFLASVLGRSRSRPHGYPTTTFLPQAEDLRDASSRRSVRSALARFLIWSPLARWLTTTLCCSGRWGMGSSRGPWSCGWRNTRSRTC